MTLYLTLPMLGNRQQGEEGRGRGVTFMMPKQSESYVFNVVPG